MSAFFSGSDCLALTKLTRMSEPKCSQGETLGPARPMSLQSKKRDQALTGSPFKESQRFVSRVNHFLQVS